MATKAPSLLEKLKEQLTCAICRDIYTSPRILPCYHSFCLQCLEGLNCDHNHSIVCPYCRHRTNLPDESQGLTGFPVAFHLITLKETYDEALKDLELNCPKHDKSLQYFCEECDLLLCIECKNTDHVCHDTGVICDVLKKNYKKLHNHLQLLRKTEYDAKKTLYQLATNEKEITEQNMAIKEEICVMEKEMISAIQQSTKKLHRTLEMTTNSKLQELSIQKQTIEKYIDNLEACTKTMEHRLANSNGKEVLMSKTQMIDTMDKTMETMEDLKSMVKNVKIQLIKNNEVDKEIHHIGDIVSDSSNALQECQVKEIDQIKYPLPYISFPLSLECPDTSLLTVPVSSINCSLVTVGRQPITASVTSTSHPGVYNIHCSPLIRGSCQVNVQIDDVQLENTSIEIPFNPYLDTITPVRTIGQLNCPYGVAVSDDGSYIIVTECGMHDCVIILDSEGKKLKSFGGELGNGDVKISSPHGVAITVDNFIIVADAHKIQMITMNGECIASVGEYGGRLGQFNCPAGIAISPTTGQIYVADRYNHRIQILNPDLTFSRSFGKEGTAKGEFRYPWDIAFDGKGFLYVTDNSNHRIQVFTDRIRGVKFVAEFNNNSQLGYPRGIVFDKSTDLIYVTQHYTDQIIALNCEGQCVTSFGQGMSNAKGLDCSSGYLYICGADNDENNIVVM